jgi:PPOX class probable FMN-dependent enzyme
MTATTERYAVTSVERLREIIDQPKPDAPAVRKQIDTLDAHCRAFIAKAPFLLLSTAGASGRCDVSPRGDGPGFVLVLDDKTLVVPDRPGNRRLDSFQNILENPHAGLIFMVPNVDETLRVNGRAWLTEEPALLAQMTMSGKPPSLGVVVEAEEILFHCARAFKRAHLWETATWINRSELPTLGQILHDQLNPEDVTVADYDCWLDESNKRLY